MRKQLQYTTAFVLVLLLVLVGVLQLVKQMPGSNELTTATVAVQDCDMTEESNAEANNAEAADDSDEETAACISKER